MGEAGVLCYDVHHCMQAGELSQVLECLLWHIPVRKTFVTLEVIKAILNYCRCGLLSCVPYYSQQQMMFCLTALILTKDAPFTCPHVGSNTQAQG